MTLTALSIRFVFSPSVRIAYIMFCFIFVLEEGYCNVKTLHQIIPKTFFVWPYSKLHFPVTQRAVFYGHAEAFIDVA